MFRWYSSGIRKRKGEKDLELLDKLIDLLSEIQDNEEFVVSVLSYAYTDQDHEILLAFIENGEDVNVDTVLGLAMNLYDRHKK